MPISLKHKITFPHIPRCAGTSLSNALKEIDQPFNIALPDAVNTTGWEGIGHHSLKDIEDRFGDQFKEGLAFAVVRDPFLHHYYSMFRFYVDCCNNNTARQQIEPYLGGKENNFAEWFDWITEGGNVAYISVRRWLNTPVDKLFALDQMEDVFSTLQSQLDSIGSGMVISCKHEKALVKAPRSPSEKRDLVRNLYTGATLLIALTLFREDVAWLLQRCPQSVLFLIPMYEEAGIDLFNPTEEQGSEGKVKSSFR